MNKWLATVGYVFVTMVWGGGFIISDLALNSLKPFQIMVCRFFLATVFMGAFCMKNIKQWNKEAIKAGCFMGLALFAGFAFQIVGLQYTTPSKNAFLTALNVVIVPFIAYIILKKKVGIKGILGAVMSVTGVAVLSVNENFTLGLGDGLTILCAIGFAFQIFLTGEYVKKYSVAVLNFIQMTTAFVLSLISMVLLKETEIVLTMEGGLCVVYLGVVSTTVCYLIQTTCQKYVDETKSAIILSMESVFGTIFSVIILKEMITLRMILGCVMILSAVILSNVTETTAETKKRNC